jgi:hypothetical protein
MSRDGVRRTRPSVMSSLPERQAGDAAGLGGVGLRRTWTRARGMDLHDGVAEEVCGRSGVAMALVNALVQLLFRSSPPLAA